MGTLYACLYATLYYAEYEHTTLLPTFQNQLFDYRRFIDDIFGVWVGTVTEFETFKASLPFGDLTWTTSSLSRDVSFLDLQLSIDSSRVSTQTYSKSCNLFLWSLIFGNLRRFYLKNSRTTEYIATGCQSFPATLARVWPCGT